jgi:hypothetical protein
MSPFKSNPEPLYELPPIIKRALIAFLLLQLSGVLFGVGTLFMRTELSMSGTTAHYRGDPTPSDEFEIQEHFEKPLSELLLTTHNHLLGFSFIFALLVPVFYFSSIIRGRLKAFLMVEPFISVLLTFLSIWGLRFISPSFVVVTMFFGVLTYASYFLMVGVVGFELVFKKK